uniref:ABC transporter system permease protein n=1 Tax=uncultured prokaryote TaxID=198431 RepID=H5SIP4_9ZZZZ|nr:ABC transporter system permease protein [uncultured prokaryote]
MNRRILLTSLLLLTLFGGLGLALPEWVIFLMALALAKGLVVLSVVLLMRAGLVSFGQGLFYAAAAYAVGFAINRWGIGEATVLLAIGVMASMALAALIGVVIARYREIFFGMLSLAFSMAFYGVLVKAYDVTGGSDGMGIAPPTILGLAIPSEWLRLSVYYLVLICVAIMLYLVYRYIQSPLGTLIRAIRDNEVRVAYLGGSVHRAIYLTYVLAAGLGGLGGVLVAINVGHVDPELAYWTTSGEFVFVALLGGTGSVFAPLAGAIAYELVKSYAFKFSPYTWQMTLGTLMLGIIFLLPGGLWSLGQRLHRRQA